MTKINVTKPYLPPKSEYQQQVSEIFDNCILTNQGPKVQELESTLKKYLQAENFHYVTNGTIALQLALKALAIEDGEIITTPFSYVATTSSILWERCKPVFVDIEADNFTIDADKIEAAITPRTKAIMAVHVFGYACAIEKIQEIADRHNLKVIYDAAHSFGSRYKGQALSCYGDISTLSFHATKLFHTIEGGACIVKEKAVSERLEMIKRFGHQGDDYYCLGINAKQDEFNAAMGLAIFPHLSEITAKRWQICNMYDDYLSGVVTRPKFQDGLEYNYAYYPVLFGSEEELLKVFAALNAEEIFPRRYFYPSLNNLPYLQEKQICPVSEDISRRIACLPFYPGLSEEIISKICQIVKTALLNVKMQETA